MRTWSDLFVEEAEFNKLKNDGFLEKPQSKFYGFSLENL